MIPAFPSNILKAVVVFNMGNTERTNPVKKRTWCTLYTRCVLCASVCSHVCVCACVHACACVCVCVYFIMLCMTFFINFCVFCLFVCLFIYTNDLCVGICASRFSLSCKVL